MLNAYRLIPNAPLLSQRGFRLGQLLASVNTSNSWRQTLCPRQTFLVRGMASEEAAAKKAAETGCEQRRMPATMSQETEANLADHNSGEQALSCLTCMSDPSTRRDEHSRSMSIGMPQAE